jgi:7,8-dihydroneopterin aldolase/epimerase/oxygenase
MNHIQTTVHIEGLEIPAHVGLHAPERDVLQTVVIDITCTLDLPQITNDDLSQSADYVPIVQSVKELAQEKRRRLIETFAEEIADVCFLQPHVARCEIRINKPQKLPGTRAVGITRTFTKGV